MSTNAGLLQGHLPRLFLRYHGIAEPLPDRPVSRCLDGWLIYWHAGGRVEVDYGGQTLIADRRHVLIRSPHCQFARRTIVPGVALWFHVQLGLPVDMVRDRLLRLDIDNALQKRFDRLVAEMRCANSPTAGDFAQRLRYLSLLSHCLALAPADLWQESAADPRLAQAVRFMQEHCHSRLENAVLARLVGMSCNGFIRLFSQRFGMSPQRYQMRLRLEEAAQLLVQNHMGIDAIAEYLGFTDRSHFSRRFKQQHGISPAQLRAQQVLLA